MGMPQYLPSNYRAWEVFDAIEPHLPQAIAKRIEYHMVNGPLALDGVREAFMDLSTTQEKRIPKELRAALNRAALAFGWTQEIP